MVHLVPSMAVNQLRKFVRKACPKLQKTPRLQPSMCIHRAFAGTAITLCQKRIDTDYGVLRFISSQLQLEADAREALPYVCILSLF